MPQTLGLIPVGQQIVDPSGAITLFFRQRWEELRSAFTRVPTVANPGASDVQSAALPTTTIYTVINGGGRFLVGVNIRRTAIDGVASALQPTWSWVQNAVALSHVGRNMNVDSTSADPTDGPVLIEADANTNIQLAISYTVNTPGNCKYRYTPFVSPLA